MSNPIQLSESVFYLPGGVNSAILVGEDKRAVLVDTGGDKDAGRRIRKACDSLNITPIAIVNTHSHADHYGGNDYLVRNLNLPVYAPPFEASIMQSPYLEPVYLFGGAKPPRELTSKWLLAKPSPVNHLLEPGRLELAGLTLDVIESSGHAHTHYAVKVDDVLFAADAVFGEKALEKYPLPFGQDIVRQIASAEKMATLGARVILPGHGEPTEEVDELVQKNVETFQRAADVIEEVCTGVGTATVLKRTCKELHITMTDLPRYYLNLCTVMAYLSHLRNLGRVRLEMQDNAPLWSKA